MARYCPNVGRVLYGNGLFQYVQNYLEFLYGYKDFTEEYPEIINSIKKSATNSSGIPLFMYNEIMDDYHLPGGHSGGSFSLCLASLHHLIKINTSHKSKKVKVQSWREFCIINRLY